METAAEKPARNRELEKRIVQLTASTDVEVPITSTPTCKNSGCSRPVYHNRAICRECLHAEQREYRKTKKQQKGVRPVVPHKPLTPFLIQARAARDAWVALHEWILENPEQFSEEDLIQVFHEGAFSRNAAYRTRECVRKLLKLPENKKPKKQEITNE